MISTRFFRYSASALIALLLSGGVASAQWSLGGDWQSEPTFTAETAVNPNGAWSYGVYDSGFNGGAYQNGTYSLAAAVQPSTFDPFTQSTSSDLEMAGPGSSAWAAPSGGQPSAFEGGGPVMLFNYNAGPDAAGYGFNVQANTVETFDVFGPSVARWTSPVTGTVNVSATFTDPLFDPTNSGSALYSTNSGVPDYLVMHNGTIVADQIATDATNSSFFTYTYDPTQGLYYETFTVNTSVTVTAGDTLDFVVNPQFVDQGAFDAEGNHTDPVLMTADINLAPTPEPSSIVLLGLAGVGLALAAWKRRRAA
jgi:PEP-CTERM motif